MFLILCRTSDARCPFDADSINIFSRWNQCKRSADFKLLQTTFADKIDHDSWLTYVDSYDPWSKAVPSQANPVVLLWYQFIKIYIWFPYFAKTIYIFTSFRKSNPVYIYERNNNNNCNERWRWLSFDNINYVLSVRQTFNDNSNLCFCRYSNYYSLHETENDSNNTQTLNEAKCCRICNETKICSFFVILHCIIK